MIILPPPWEGLHPAFPKRPDPFNTNALTNAPIFGGTLGLVWATGATLFRRNPATGIKAAAWTTLISAVVGVSAEQLVGKIHARPYLESKGITVPRQRIVSRLSHLDEDTFILAGGFAGVLLSRAVAKPWSVTGWKRVVGAFSMGAYAGDWTNYAFHWRKIVPCAEQVQKQKELKVMYQEELRQFRSNQVMTKYGISIQGGSGVNVMGASGTAVDDPAKQVGTTSMQQLLRSIQKTAEENIEKMAGMDAKRIDEEDPQPHFSDMRDGERVFRPDTNYAWSGTPEDLESHISVLRQRRESLKSEAELLWHKMAVREAEYHSTSEKKEEGRIALEIMNHLHINAYLEISQLDWMIADSQKTQLQLKTLRDGKGSSPWIPPPPPNSNKLVPKHTMQLLDELERDTANGLDEMELLRAATQAALHDPQLEAVDSVSGQRVADPWAAVRKDLDEVDKTTREMEIMKEAIEKLKRELGGR